MTTDRELRAALEHGEALAPNPAAVIAGVHAGIRRRRARRQATSAVTSVGVVALAAAVVTATGSSAPASAKTFLDKAAAAAADTAQLTPSGKYTVVETLDVVTWTGPAPAPKDLPMTAHQTTWRPVDGTGDVLTRSSVAGESAPPFDLEQPQQLCTQLVVHNPGTPVFTPRCVPAPPMFYASYDYLKALPTDPAALLQVVYAQADEVQRIQAQTAQPGTPTPRITRDQEAFALIEGALNYTVVPNQTRAALFRAIERIPGVGLRTDAVDAAGRHGIAVTVPIPFPRGPKITGELIFDPATFQFLGGRWMTEGQTLHVTAVTDRAFADRPGQQP